MRWWTSTWSPMRKSGMSFLMPASSTYAISLFFMVLVLFSVRSCRHRLGHAPAANFGLFVSPAGYRLVIAAHQNLGHGHAAKEARPCVLRIFQPARYAMRLLVGTGCIAQDAGHKPYHAVDQH